MANNKPELGALIVAKPGAIEGQLTFAKEEIVKYGFEILREGTVVPTEDQITKFYISGEDGKEWEKNLGEKIFSASTKAGINVLEHFGTVDPAELGLLGRKWNEDYLRSGEITILLIGPNGHDQKNFFIRLSEAVEHFRLLFCGDDIGLANKERRAYRNAFHLSRTPEEFDYQYSILFPPE